MCVLFLMILIIYDYIILLYNDYNDYPIIMGIIEYIIDISFNLLIKSNMSNITLI